MMKLVDVLTRFDNARMRVQMPKVAKRPKQTAQRRTRERTVSAVWPSGAWAVDRDTLAKSIAVAAVPKKANGSPKVNGPKLMVLRDCARILIDDCGYFDPCKLTPQSDAVRAHPGGYAAWCEFARELVAMTAEAMPDDIGSHPCGFTVELSAVVPNIKALTVRLAASITDNEHPDKVVRRNWGRVVTENLPKELSDRKMFRLMADPELIPHVLKGTPLALIVQMFAGTPITKMLRVAVPLSLPESVRLMHVHIMKSTGGGKSMALKALIKNSLPGVLAGKESIFLFDTQGDLADVILRHSGLPPEKIIYVNPDDDGMCFENNLFDAGDADVINYVLEGLNINFTGKQAMFFAELAEIMKSRPGSTIADLMELLGPEGGTIDRYIPFLDKDTLDFVKSDWNNFDGAKQQIRYRLRPLLRVPAFRRLIGGKKSSFKIHEELDKGCIMIVRMDKGDLGESVPIIARIFIALIERAMWTRPLRAGDAAWWICLDEMLDIVGAGNDKCLSRIHAQGRKRRVGTVLIHQNLGQLPSGVQQSTLTNCGARFYGNLNPSDSTTLGGVMGCGADFFSMMSVTHMSHATFAVSVNGSIYPASTARVDLGQMESMPEISDAELAQIMKFQRQRWARLDLEAKRPSDNVVNMARAPWAGNG
jgi:hypothetical protein